MKLIMASILLLHNTIDFTATCNAMNCNTNDDDSSFPSLDRIYSQDEENNHIGLITLDGDSISQASSLAIACGMIVEPDDEISHADDGHAPRSSPNLFACKEIHSTENYVDAEDGSTLDGYPTDEKTIQSMWSWAPSKENQRQRLNILELARKSLARKKTETNTNTYCVSNDVAANVNTRDVENQATLKTTQGKDDEQYVFGFSFLTNINGEEVEEQPDDTSFIVGAGVEDVTGDIRSILSDGTQQTSNTMYDVRASTMSRATASTKASFISKELKLASQTGGSLDNAVDEDQSMSTYSYGRAFADTGTFTQASNYVSTISALTDDNSHIRRTGMGEAINASPQCSVIHEHPSFDTSYQSPLRSDSFSMNKTVYSRPVDADTGTFITKSSHEASVARPPQTNSFDYENPDHLARMLSYGEGQSNVSGGFDETYRTTKNNNGRCCSWMKSSSLLVKLCVILSVILSLVSIASLTLALLLPEQMKSFFNDSNFGRNERNGGGSELNGMTNPTSIKSPTVAPSSLTCESRKWYSVKTADGSKKKCSNGYRKNVEESSMFDSLDQCCDALYKKIANCKFENVCIFSGEPTLFPTAAPNVESEIMILTLQPTQELELSPPTVSEIMTVMPSSLPSSLPPISLKPTLRPTPEPESSPPKDPADDLIMLPSLSPDSPTQTISGGKAVRLQAAADGTINHKFPDNNYGYSDELRVDSMPESWTIISFDLTSDTYDISQIQRMQINPVFRATLRLYTLDQGESAQIFVRPNAQQWSETDLTWSNKDRLIDRSGELYVSSMEWVTGFAWNEVDVTAAFANIGSLDSLLTFVIRAESNDGITFASRKKDSGSLSPELVLTFANVRTIDANPPLLNPPKIVRTTSVPTYYPTLAPTLIEPK